MNRRPNLIAPVIIVACGLIVVGGIGIALSENGDAAATAGLRIGLPKEGAAASAPTLPAVTGAEPATTIGTAATGTGAGGAGNETEPAPPPTPANGTAGAGTGAPTATGTGCGAATGTIAGTFAPAAPGEGRAT